MKKLLFALSVVFAATALNAQTTIEKGPKISFSKEVHDYGNIKYDGDPNCSFEFTNTGDEPLIISNAKGSCGCTVPEWPKEPILPGKSAKITVHYNTQGRPGPIFKSVFIQSNAQLPEGKDRYEIFIRGTVTQAAPAAAPAK